MHLLRHGVVRLSDQIRLWHWMAKFLATNRQKQYRPEHRP
jgi:hypothetical protein